MQYPTGTCIISRLSHLYTKFGQVVMNNSRYIVISMCVDNEFLVGSTYEAHLSLWRNDSHCVYFYLLKGKGLLLSQYRILRYTHIFLHIVSSMCVGNEFLVGSTYTVQQNLWRNDSHCVCLCLYRSFMFRHTCLVFCPDLEYK